MTHSQTLINSQTQSLLNGGKAGWDSTIMLQGTSVQFPPSPPQRDCHLLKQLYPIALNQNLLKREREVRSFWGELKSQGNGSEVKGKQRGKDDKKMQRDAFLLHDVVLRGLKPNRCTHSHKGDPPERLCARTVPWDRRSEGRLERKCISCLLPLSVSPLES